MNDLPPSYPFLLYKKTAQGKSSINLDMMDSALRRQGPHSFQRSCFKKSIRRANRGFAGWRNTVWGLSNIQHSLKTQFHV